MTNDELRVVAGLVHSSCSTDTKLSTGEKVIDSGAIGGNADGMRLLARYGLMKLETDVGRHVRATWTKAGIELLG